MRKLTNIPLRGTLAGHALRGSPAGNHVASFGHAAGVSAQECDGRRFIGQVATAWKAPANSGRRAREPWASVADEVDQSLLDQPRGKLLHVGSEAPKGFRP